MIENDSDNLDSNPPKTKGGFIKANYFGASLIKLIFFLFDSLHFLLAPQAVFYLFEDELEQIIHEQINEQNL